MQIEQEIFGVRFRNPVLLAGGTCGFGEELNDVLDFDRLGGIVTKSVTYDPRVGNAAPRVVEAGNAMLNSIGLANPGVEVVCSDKIPWMNENLPSLQVFISVAGHLKEEYCAIVKRLEKTGGFLGYELNLSCPNDVKMEGMPFALDPESLKEVVSSVRELTDRPILVKLAPNVPDIGLVAQAAEVNGADGVTLINTIPGLAIDVHSQKAELGAGQGGVSGPALRAVGVYAVHRARQKTRIPLVGAGGIMNEYDAIQYLLAGASLVQVGTATFANPRAAQGIARGIVRFCENQKIDCISSLIGAYTDDVEVAGDV
ncbi:MAG: dihydroorotate dehydrogenase [Longimicrobiales bacterium]|jgi:dihydroorotate dehydrogenase (NAD+) catalytic subunit|nr:dihydroorotate dehydrogenase [Longimicrobiales bacterium]